MTAVLIRKKNTPSPGWRATLNSHWPDSPTKIYTRHGDIAMLMCTPVDIVSFRPMVEVMIFLNPHSFVKNKIENLNELAE